MSCQRIQGQLRRGEKTASELEAHLADCFECAEVAAEVAGLGRDDDFSLPDVGGVFRALESSIADDRGLRARLASRSTSARLLLAIVFAFGVPLGFGLATLRVDASVYPALRFAVIAAVLGASLAAAVWIGLRPLHRPALRPSVVLALLAIGAAGVVLTGALPPAHALHPDSLAGVGDDFARRAAACFGVGLAIGVPVSLAVRVLSRARASWLGTPAASLFAGAIAGNLALHLHCPLVAPRHLLTGHASVLVPFTAALLLLRVRWRSADR